MLEIFVLFKTTKACLPALEKLILAQHPYDTPEFIALPFASGTPRYLAWIEAIVGKSRRMKTKRANRRS